MPLPQPVIEWRNRGEFHELAGLDVFCLDTAPPGNDVAVLVLHGFPSSSYDWRRVLPVLGAGRRVVLLDFPGFGLSAKPADHAYSLFEQADVAEQLLARLGIRRAHLISHDMGTSVACELAARRERGLLGFEMGSLVLMNGSVHVEMARLTPSQKLLLSPLRGLFTRLAGYPLFRAQLGRILGKAVDESEYQAMWAQIKHNDGKRRMPQLIGYVRERRRFGKRWTGALRSLDVPVLVLWGPLDPVAVRPIAERLAGEIPGASLHWLEGLGHYPMIEDPETTARALVSFLDRAGCDRD